MTLEKVKSATCADPDYDFLVTCAPGLTELLTDELAGLSLKVTAEGRAAVTFRGRVEDALRVCLHSHLAERVLCRLVKLEVEPDEAPRALAQAFDWSTHLARADAVHVEVETGRGVTRNGLALARDFIAAAPQRLTLSAEARNALTLQLYVAEQQAELAVDLSGEPLQRRGYRLAGGKAPLRETLAAALLRAAGWQGETPLLDPFCGSGTILIEAALIAQRKAPGLQRDFFGFMQWSQVAPTLWPLLCQQAKRNERTLPASVFLKGFDADADSLRYARANAERAGVAQQIHFERRELGALRRRDFGDKDVIGSVVTNPPWGERLETEPRAGWLHAALGYKLAELAPAWPVTLLGARVSVLDQCGMDLQGQHTLLNGAEKNWIRNYTSRRKPLPAPLLAGEANFEVDELAVPLCNRLQKNARQLKSWINQNGIQCYRLYDRDLPEFNFTIDIYGDRALMQEQQAPKTIDEEKVKARRLLAQSAVRASLGCHREQVLLRTRARQKGNLQYQKLGEQGRYRVVQEGAAKLLVNLEDYLDTGLFLDHRLMRLKLGEQAAGKRFLNLFAYTGSATVQAAVGGAKMSVTVDASKRYLDWAANNLALNGFSTLHHELVCSDVRAWLASNHDQFDLIFCDPPTFSNSKSRDDFVVQRDHAELIRQLVKKLTPEGVLYFSCNFRGFVLDESISRWYRVKDISRQTLDKDVARRQDAHFCFEIRHEA